MYVSMYITFFLFRSLYYQGLRSGVAQRDPAVPYLSQRLYPLKLLRKVHWTTLLTGLVKRIAPLKILI